MVRPIAFVFTFCVLAVLIGGLGYFHFVLKPQFIKTAISQAPKPVTTVMAEEAKTESWVPKVPAIGTFKAIQGIDVAPQLGGIVAAIHFDSGQEVQAGAPILEIDDSTEQADLKNGEAQLKNADVALERQRSLLSTNNTAKASFDAALAARDSAAATVERYKAIIAQKAIKAPFSGRLGMRKVDIGQYVSPGMSLTTLQQLDPIYVDFSLPEQNFEALRIGQSVEVEVDAYPGQTFAGKIQSIDARVSQDTRNIMVRAQLDNKEKRLLPGMFANVNVVAGTEREVVTVPRTAVTYSLYGDSVFVVKAAPPAPAAPAPGSAQGGPAAAAGPAQAATPAAPPAEEALIAERRFVRTGETRADRVAIVEGVAAGERVVTAGQIKLQPNARVRIDPNANLQPQPVRPKE
ncbi:MAG: efflux RND transporter periplasmic adaptor subunit [Methylobacteriaceae bacterium]|nr:efflux RND transporter periplasmic adaptor subunit [Methylobacteriaceae bacterium]